MTAGSFDAGLSFLFADARLERARFVPTTEDPREVLILGVDGIKIGTTGRLC